MKTLKFFLLAVIGSLSLGAAAQNYEVKGVVIDAKGEPVVGATVRTNKSKAAAVTKAGGVYTLTATPKDTELRLIMNKCTVMEKELSATIAAMPIAFELDETTDPAVVGYMVGDTYYPGEADDDINNIFASRFTNAKLNTSGYVQILGSKSYVSCFVVDGTVQDFYSIGLSGLPSVKTIYSITALRDGSAYGILGGEGAVVIVTKAHHEANKSVEKADISVGKDSIRGVVKDGWGRVVPDMKIKTPSGEIAVSDDSGRYAIRVTNKDKYLRCVMDYTEGTTVRISKANTSKPVNLIVMLRQNDLRGWFSDDLKTYFPGAADGDWASIISRFPATDLVNEKVYFVRHQLVSFNQGDTSGKSDEEEPKLLKGREFEMPALIIVDGVAMEDATIESIEPHSVYSIQMIKENAVPIYGMKAQNGAVVITTKGMQKGAVAMTDFESVAARRRGDMKGFIAAQGKNLEYDDGYIKVNGERCQLYIINDKEFSHMRGIDVEMIDDIIILNDDYTASYGPRAKNGVVLISASQKEKRVVDEEGNTVTEKEYKQQQKNKKK
ncbi:MAG: hypothetical protein IKT29_04200 [Flavobacteriales bacterium]|nr:hypothetical protein [Flavobacteriales bacterium]